MMFVMATASGYDRVDGEICVGAEKGEIERTRCDEWESPARGTGTQRGGTTRDASGSEKQHTRDKGRRSSGTMPPHVPGIPPHVTSEGTPCSGEVSRIPSRSSGAQGAVGSDTPRGRVAGRIPGRGAGNGAKRSRRASIGGRSGRGIAGVPVSGVGTRFSMLFLVLVPSMTGRRRAITGRGRDR